MPRVEKNSDTFSPSDTFVHRHIGPRTHEIDAMLRVVGCNSLDELIDQTVPANIRMKQPLRIETHYPSPDREGGVRAVSEHNEPLPHGRGSDERNSGSERPRGEHELIEQLRRIASQNKVMRSMIGQGYYDCITPPVILRNILENPGWYTQYTPYQAEISQGRLESLLNFQTMVADLVALPLANASLLDEATAAAEAMAMCRAIAPWDAGPDGGTGVGPRNIFLVADDCHPQTINVVKTRAKALGIEVALVNDQALSMGDGAEHLKQAFGLLLQYPTTDGRIEDYSELIEWVHKGGIRVVVATDLLACTLIKPPGEFGADIAIGSAQRFGVPMGFGGPHAAFLATREEFARQMPGRIIGVSKDSHGRPAYRLAIQTREQHIRREKATSNICTAQALLANIAAMYAVYHGPEGLRDIAERINRLLCMLGDGLKQMGHETDSFAKYFDTLPVTLANGLTSEHVQQAAKERGINLRRFSDILIGVSLDETTTIADVETLLMAFSPKGVRPPTINSLLHWADSSYEGTMARASIPTLRNDTQFDFLTHPVFNSYHSETEMLRYLKRLENRDLSLAHSMIPLGSCTMKLNATSEMIPVTWPEFSRMHPYAPAEQTQGYAKLFADLEAWLAEITGLPAVSLQPNAGSQGEYAGLLAIRAYHESKATTGQKSEIGTRKSEISRDICLIPTSAHGTNPASAITAGFRVVTVACDTKGNIDLADLRNKAEQHADRLGAIMVTYPSTHGVFEEGIRELCDIVHQHGGQVYMDGANMNAQVGLCRPGDIGADVCHLNLHKTFCIPHGGGGPGMGPIAVAQHLAAFLPGNPMGEGGQWPVASEQSSNRKSEIGNRKSPVGPVSAANYGSASILPISWVYIALMGGEGLKRATEVAILNANYMAKRLEQHYPILYSGKAGRVAHEFIADCRQFEKTSGIKVEDIAKRLMDFGFHAPTMSFPVPGTLMIEPTESESKAELDRLCDALILIREEIRAIEEGRADRADNALKHAPHTAEAVSADDWPHKYSREQAAYPAPWVRERKFWPAVGRIDNVYGDRNLFCTCPTINDA